MRRKPATAEDDEGGLDSLLDTMTNVVGILVMVLIATQLGVKEAVVRIAEADVVSAEDVNAAGDELRTKTATQEKLQAELKEFQQSNADQIDEQLAEYREQRDEQHANLKMQNEITAEYAARIADEESQAEAAKKEVREMLDQKDAVREQLTEALEEVAKLKAQLDDTPERKVLPAKLVRLPNPRPAPEGTVQATLLCVNNRVYPINADNIRTLVRQAAETVVKRRRLDRGPALGVDQEQFLKYFAAVRDRMRDDFFSVEVYASGIYPRLRFIPLEDGGATEEEVLRRGSRFQRLLLSLDRNKYYARFIVLPDSYGVYVAARSIADQAGLLAGWDPQAAGWQYTTHLGGPILFGPKPPPAPPPKPGTTPPPKKKPANVID